MTDLKGIISKNLRALRQKHRLTQAEMAEKIETSFRSYQNYETGKRIPKQSVLDRTCSVFKIDVSSLLADTASDFDNASDESKSILLAEMMSKMARLDLKNLRELERFLNVIYAGQMNPKKVSKSG